MSPRYPVIRAFTGETMQLSAARPGSTRGSAVRMRGGSPGLEREIRQLRVRMNIGEASTAVLNCALDPEQPSRDLTQDSPAITGLASSRCEPDDTAADPLQAAAIAGALGMPTLIQHPLIGRIGRRAWACRRADRPVRLAERWASGQPVRRSHRRLGERLSRPFALCGSHGYPARRAVGDRKFMHRRASDDRPHLTL